MTEYTIGLAERARHLYTVEARFSVEGSAVDLRMAVWTPGSYLVREYQRHLQDLTITDGEGHPLSWTKIDKATWRVEAGGARTVVARYAIYAHELTVRTAHLDGTHAFWNGACVYLYHPPLADSPSLVTVGELPEGWRIHTALDPDPSHPRSFRAPDLDALIDSPFEVGPDPVVELEAAGKPHQLTFWGRFAPGRYDTDRLAADTGKIIEAHAAIFGGVPYERYAFFVHLAPGAHGGLEHARCATILASSLALTTEKRYQDLLELLSHEYFHLWNVKRLRPEVLGPFDYAKENHTRSLWVVEGWTSYYDRQALVRARLQSPARYLEKLSEEIGKIQAIPGRKRQSLEESSFDAWIKLYRPDENSVNSTISYYLKGSVVALLLDLEIRRRTGDRRTLDDALRLLWRRYGLEGRGYPDAAVQPTVEEAAGVPLADFFDRSVRGTAELDYATPLAHVGLTIRRSSGDDDAPGAWLGLATAADGPLLRVTESTEAGPAQSAGVHPGDLIVALDGFRVDGESALKERIGARRPGDRARLTLFRRDELREIEVPLGARPDDTWEVVPVESPSDEQRRAYKAWLLDEWKPADDA